MSAEIDFADLTREVRLIADNACDEAIAEAIGEAADRLERSIDFLAGQVKRVADGLVAGTLNIRTHHPACVAPPEGDYTVQQLDAMSKYLNQSIETGAFALPQQEGVRS